MRCKRIYILLAVLFVAGCASTGKGSGRMQSQNLQEEVSRLKEDIRQKDERIAYLEDRAYKAQDQKTERKTKAALQKQAVDSVRMTPRQIQAALKKAGFYKGTVDGRIEQETKRAICDFQKANGLKADGIAGKQTCAKLRKYLQ